MHISLEIMHILCFIYPFDENNCTKGAYHPLPTYHFQFLRISFLFGQYTQLIRDAILVIFRDILKKCNSLDLYIYMFISYSHGILLYYDKHYYEYTQ